MGERSAYTLGVVVGLTLRAWRPTLRWTSRRHELLDSPCVLAFWHGRLLGVLMDNLGSGAVSMASRSADGALAAGALVAVGIHPTRGSGSSGGRDALRAMKVALEGGAPFAGLTVDGPRGPWRRVHPGVVLLSRWLDIPVVPASFSCRHGRVLSSWDRLVLPRPLTRVVVEYGPPLRPADLPKSAEDAAGAVASALEALTARLDDEVAGRQLWPAL